MSGQQDQNRNDTQGERSSPSWGQTIGSIVAAAFGVQSSKHRQRDFKQGSAVRFIVGGIVFTVVFVLVVVMVVKIVLRHAGM
jgi:hypothetical protein